MKTTTRRMLVLAFILVTSFGLLSVLNYRTIASQIHDDILTSSLPLLQENLYTEMLSDLTPAINIASVMAADTFLIRWAETGEQDSEAVIEYLDRIGSEYGFLSTFFVSAQTFNYYHPTGITKQVSEDDVHDDWFFNFVAADTPYAIEVDTNQQADNRLTIFINYRLESASGQLLGVTGVGIELLNIAQLLAERQERYGRDIYLVDGAGVVRAHPLLARVGTSAGLPDGLLTGQRSMETSVERNGELILVSGRLMPEFGWYVVVEQSETAALASPRANMIRTVAIGLVVSVLVLFLSALSMARFDRELTRLATTDALTGANNRRAFDRAVGEYLSRADRQQTPLALIAFDVDHFKRINDEFGHQVGDRALVSLAETVRSVTRPIDIFARWGGDEFMILLEGSRDAALRLVERLRTAIDEVRSEPGAVMYTLSIGIAERREDERAPAFIRRADEALYLAKELGRDRVCTDAATPNDKESDAVASGGSEGPGGTSTP